MSLRYQHRGKAARHRGKRTQKVHRLSRERNDINQKQKLDIDNAYDAIPNRGSYKTEDPSVYSEQARGSQLWENSPNPGGNEGKMTNLLNPRGIDSSNKSKQKMTH